MAFGGCLWRCHLIRHFAICHLHYIWFCVIGITFDVVTPHFPQFLKPFFCLLVGRNINLRVTINTIIITLNVNYTKCNYVHMFERCLYVIFNLKYVMCSVWYVFNICSDASCSQIRKLNVCMQFGVSCHDYSTKNSLKKCLPWLYF